MGNIINTSKVVSSFRYKMMLYLLLAVPLVWGGTLPGSPDLLLGPGGHYEHPIDPDYYSQNEVFKIKDKDDCHPVERTVYKYLGRMLAIHREDMLHPAGRTVQGRIREE